MKHSTFYLASLISDLINVWHILESWIMLLSPDDGGKSREEIGTSN